MIVEDVFKLDGGYYAAFFLESEKVVSPPLASVDEALRFVDRCRVAWFGPDGESRYGMEIHFPIEAPSAPDSGSAPSALDPGSVLQWRAPVALEWLAARFLLAPHDPAYGALRRLALTGRMLLLRPASALRPRLLEKLREEAPGAGPDEQDAIEAVLDTLDDEVALLAERAANECAEAGAREEIERLLAHRRRGPS
eukprot:tig00021357_g20788.t1